MTPRGSMLEIIHTLTLGAPNTHFVMLALALSWLQSASRSP
jgi:hypothetical protein